MYFLYLDMMSKHYKTVVGLHQHFKDIQFQNLRKTFSSHIMVLIDIVLHNMCILTGESDCQKSHG